MVIIDGSFLLGLAAVLSSLGTLWRAVRCQVTHSCQQRQDCAKFSCAAHSCAKEPREQSN